MGRPGVLQKPELPDGQHRKLNDALHRLHLLAGRPSLTVMARELRDADISKSTIHNAFSSPRFPKWEVVDALIEILASRAPGLTPEQELRPIYDFWVRAAETDGLPIAQPLQITQPLPIAQPLRKLLLLAEIEQFRMHYDITQAHLWHRLHDFTDRMMAAAGIDAEQRHSADRGDSVMELIDDSTALSPVLRTLLEEAPAYLREENQRFKHPIRLRIVLATAHVTIDNHHGGWMGAELSAAGRLLDGQALRDALRESADDVALCLSDPVYQVAVQAKRGGASPADFRTSFKEVTVKTKNGPVPAWIAKFL